MVTPQAQWLEVTRIGHNLGKIHDAEMASFELRHFEADCRTPIRTERLDIPGSSFRKTGMAMDRWLYHLPAATDSQSLDHRGRGSLT